MKTLSARIDEISKDIGEDISDKFLDFMTSAEYYKTKEFGRYTFQYEEGYTGSEGGGENINFIISIKTPDSEKEFWNIVGYYSSYDASEIDLEYCEAVEFESQEVTVTRNVYKKADNTVVLSSYKGA
jgi:hypothetical protein